jgi:hypothetical protein
MRAIIFGGLAAITCASAHAQLFQPNSAVAGSTFSSPDYNIANTINGSGLASGFTPSTPHADYTNAGTGNHWTTASNAITAGNAWAEFSFTSPVTIGTFHMWNHRSNGIASNGLYGVREFNLKLYDSSNNLLFQLLNQGALANVATAQSYGFAPVANVSKVRFEILKNGQPNNSSFTGLAEVAFEAVPEPGSMAALGLGVIAFLKRRRKNV